MPEEKVKIVNPKAADPGLAFDLQAIGGLFHSRINVAVTMTDPQGRSYESTVEVKTKVIDPLVTFVVPFGDENWHHAVTHGEILTGLVVVTLLDVPVIPGAPEPSVHQESFDVQATNGHFEVTVVGASGSSTSDSALKYFINGFRVLFGLAPI